VLVRDALRIAGSAGPVAHDAPMGRAPTMLTNRRSGGGWLCDRRPSTTTTPHHPLTRSNRTWPTYPGPVVSGGSPVPVDACPRGWGAALYRWLADVELEVEFAVIDPIGQSRLSGTSRSRHRSGGNSCSRSAITAWMSAAAEVPLGLVDGSRRLVTCRSGAGFPARGTVGWRMSPTLRLAPA
jgi:hypothetical protein